MLRPRRPKIHAPVPNLRGDDIILGELLGETTGKRVVRRVLSTEPPTVEVSFEDSSKMLGIGTAGFGTYSAVVRADGTIIGEAAGITTIQDREAITWKGSGLEAFKEHGAISYRGIIYYRMTSEKLARLNAVAGIFEYEVDPQGNTHSKVWEWK
jgi:hypothetical protein